MNSYLEMPMWELRQAWDNFVNAKAVAGITFHRMEKAYVKEFGHSLDYVKGEGGYNLFRELMMCKENKQSSWEVEGEPKSLCKLLDGGISLFFDPSDYCKQQRRVVGNIVAATSDDNAKVLVDTDVCEFIRRWKNGGSFVV